MDGLARLNDISESAVRNRPDPRSNLRKLNNGDPLFGFFLHPLGVRFWWTSGHFWGLAHVKSCNFGWKSEAGIKSLVIFLRFPRIL